MMDPGVTFTGSEPQAYQSKRATCHQYIPVRGPNFDRSPMRLVHGRFLNGSQGQLMATRQFQISAARRKGVVETFEAIASPTCSVPRFDWFDTPGLAVRPGTRSRCPRKVQPWAPSSNVETFSNHFVVIQQQDFFENVDVLGSRQSLSILFRGIGD